MVFPCREGHGFPGLIDLVDFKWLMAAEGHPVHLERLQADRGYAQQCLQCALATGSQTLQRCAARLHAVLAALPA
jgi:hypothetical protein